jgi:hypothetical protein
VYSEESVLAAWQELLDAVEEVGGTWLVTADHGNAEDMVQRDKKSHKPLMEDGKPRQLTSHTLNPVRAEILVHIAVQRHYLTCRSPALARLCMMVRDATRWTDAWVYCTPFKFPSFKKV